MLMWPRRTSRWGYFGKQRIPRWVRFNAAALLSESCATSLKEFADFRTFSQSVPLRVRTVH